MSLARNVATVGVMTLASRVLGFIRDVLIAAIFGAGAIADAFFVAFQIPNLARRLLAEGGLNAALVPLYLRRRDEAGDASAGAFIGQVSATLTVVLASMALLLALAMPLAVLLLAPGFGDSDPRMMLAISFGRLMLPYLAIAGLLAVLMGVLNANDRFGAASSAAFVFNVVLVIVLAAILMRETDGGPLSGMKLSAGVALAGLAQVILLGGAVWIGKERVTPLSVSFGPEMRRFLALAIPGLVAGGIPQLTLIAAVMVASAQPNAVSWIYYAIRLFELPLGIVSIAIGTVLVPAFTQAVRRNNRAALIASESRGLELALGLSLPAAIGLALLAHPIVRALFERGAFQPQDTAATAAALAMFALGLPGHVLVKVFAPAFFAREDTATPMRAALFGFAVAIAGSLALMPVFGHVGVALATAASGWASALVLGWLVSKRIGFALDIDARRRLPRICTAALGMGLAVGAADHLFAFWMLAQPGAVRSLALMAMLSFGLAIYIALLKAFGVASPRDFARVMRRRV